MGRNSVIILLLVLLVGGGIAAFVAYMKSHAPKYKWDTEYNKKSDQPYGLKYIYELLDKQTDNLQSVNTLELDQLDTSITNSNLISINSYLDIDSTNITYLLNYIQRGNNVFISSEGLPIYLLERLIPTVDPLEDYYYYDKDSIAVSYASNSLPFSERIKFYHQYLKDTTDVSWNGLTINDFNTVLSPYKFVPISYINDTMVNCFSIDYGKGKLVIHATPMLFTNYNMIQKNGFKNANNLFSYLNNGSIYWSDRNASSYKGNGNSSYGNNPLKFLFSHHTLKTGWYVFLVSVLLFILFRSKREQRIIPILYKNKNTSIEFAKAIGSLYYQKKAHHNIASELQNIFLSDIRSRYNVSTSLKEDELVEQIAKRTEVKKEIVVDLFKSFKDVKYNINATSKELVVLYKAIENFNNLKK